MSIAQFRALANSVARATECDAPPEWDLLLGPVGHKLARELCPRGAEQSASEAIHTIAGTPGFH